MFEGGTWIGRAQALPAAQDSTGEWFRLGDLSLQLASEPQSFLDAFRAQWGDCTVAEPPPGLPRLHCSARLLAGSSRLLLSFAGCELPDLLDASATPVRMLRHLARYADQSGPAPGWRMLADRNDGSRILAAAHRDRLVVDLDEAPPDFAIDALIAVVQSAQPGLLFLHAASFGVAGAGALLIGAAQAGKSTTALALGARGHAVLGDDMAAIRAGSSELLPFRRTLRLRPGPSVASLAARLGTVPHAFAVDPGGTMRTLVRAGALFATPACRPLPLRFAFVLDGFSTQPCLTPFRPDISSVEPLRGIVSESVPDWGRSPGRDLMKFLTIVDVLSKLSCHRLRLGTPEASASAIETLMMEATCNST
ncbi:hypothetical protein GCM10028796_57870 [Ramlibacter monticola]|uniref:Serine kinase n=1 Tax=Ramlibacter monticola TaxID=1926872 RepID=A0A936Z0G9_9BURK|nr:hypothetical protein [Ramlibacter monticola]MBL0391829.1 hypothetical protein [Ramlibacter monticola]